MQHLPVAKPLPASLSLSPSLSPVLLGLIYLISREPQGEEV